ncbi:GntR family transcriptional regulator [Pelagovum pacificum]|uniref:GntR family transcriptional regulator n=1 Tax=Pelagovum pacificum TaxID=2588711 RepID=A0A5C5GAM0_9RHOB|nr:GntR family transcriptional regulator [Pelagovum pacificum]TNY31085.1 GntR family transcriptional regulator [Pelagovum pacificum]
MEAPERSPKRVSLTDQAYEIIRRRIVLCELEPGHTFTEAELSDQMAMSKTPIREALLRLQVERMVQAIPRRGYTVTPIHVSDINDIFDYRVIIEGACAELAATQASEDDVAKLAALAERSSEEFDSIEGSDIDSVTEQSLLNNVFHESVAIAARNARLHRAAVGAIREYDRFFFLEWSAPSVYPESHSDHREIAARIAARDPQGARRAMISHIENARASLLAAVTNATASGAGELLRLR